MADKFKPSSSDLPDLSEYDALAEPDWEEVRSLADEQGWEWNDDEGAYVNDDGDVIPLSDILELTYDELERIQGEISTAVEQLENDEDVTTWEQTLAELTAATAALFFLLGIGARGNVIDSHAEHVRDRLTTQFEYLRQFSNSILDGELTIDGIRARANLYPQDAQLQYSEAQDFIHSTEEWPFYFNILGGCSHCTQCPEETAKGIVERGSLTPIGARLCLWNCCCMFQYHKTQSGDTNAYRASKQCFGWVGKSKLTLPVTVPVT
ncbi:hypothetical protein Lepto7375DRAFT_7371 [Leptolyngbya sp. PCC 7375]|nr:hypothetical protein Lepto7375DRAFT_7371 [Leptolyngbya sp. PCC 7375]